MIFGFRYTKGSKCRNALPLYAPPLPAVSKFFGKKLINAWPLTEGKNAAAASTTRLSRIVRKGNKKNILVFEIRFIAWFYKDTKFLESVFLSVPVVRAGNCHL